MYLQRVHRRIRRPLLPQIIDQLGNRDEPSFSKRQPCQHALAAGGYRHHSAVQPHLHIAQQPNLEHYPLREAAAATPTAVAGSLRSPPMAASHAFLSVHRDDREGPQAALRSHQRA